MKHILLLFLCAFLALQNLSASNGKSLDELQQMAFLHPEETLASLDSLQRGYVYPLYRLNYIRTCSLFALSRFNEALISIRSVFNSAELASDDSIRKRTYILYSKAAVYSFSKEEAMKCILKGKKLAADTGDNVLMAHMLMSEAILYRSMGLNYKAYELAIKSVNLPQKKGKDDLLSLIVRFKTYEELMSFYLYDNSYTDAMHYAQNAQKILDTLKMKSDTINLYDMYSAIFFGKMAYLSKKMGKEDMAQLYYERFSKTLYAKTHSGKQRINDYLLFIGDYDKVLSNTMEYMDNMSHQDTLNSFFSRLLNHRCKACINKEDYKQALQISKRLNNMQKNMLVNKDKDRLFEMADITELMDLRKMYDDAERKIVIYRTVVVVFAVVLFGMIFLLGGSVNRRIIYRYYWRKKREMMKNRSLIHRNDDGKEGLSTTVEMKKEAVVSGLSDAEIFSQFNAKVRKEKFFLDYQLGRDDYARIMQVDKNRFASIMKSYSGGNMATYINSLRLEYSTRLLKENIEMPISEVAAKSAIPNISTYYRLFKEKYGISPSEYRNQLK